MHTPESARLVITGRGALTLLRTAGKWLLYLAVTGGVAIATVVLLFAIQARVRLPDLRAWHRLELNGEFRAGRAGA